MDLSIVPYIKNPTPPTTPTSATVGTHQPLVREIDREIETVVSSAPDTFVLVVCIMVVLGVGIWLIGCLIKRRGNIFRAGRILLANDGLVMVNGQPLVQQQQQQPPLVQQQPPLVQPQGQSLINDQQQLPVPPQGHSHSIRR